MAGAVLFATLPIRRICCWRCCLLTDVCSLAASLLPGRTTRFPSHPLMHKMCRDLQCYGRGWQRYSRSDRTTVLVAPYTVDDGSNSLCSAALLDASEWTKVTRKSRTGRLGRPPSMQGSTEKSQEASQVKEWRLHRGRTYWKGGFSDLDRLCGTYRMKSFVVWLESFKSSHKWLNDDFTTRVTNWLSSQYMEIEGE
jgi:hypothetical protein